MTDRSRWTGQTASSRFPFPRPEHLVHWAFEMGRTFSANLLSAVAQGGEDWREPKRRLTRLCIPFDLFYSLTTDVFLKSLFCIYLRIVDIKGGESEHPRMQY